MKKLSSSSLQTGEVVTVYDESHPRGLWRLGRIEELIPGADGKIRGVRVKLVSKGGRSQDHLKTNSTHLSSGGPIQIYW